MSRFGKLEIPPPDGVFGPESRFREDKRKEKIDLIVGVNRDGEGKTETFPSVIEAQRRVIEKKLPARYLPFTGHEAMVNGVAELVYGKGFQHYLAGCQALGGTGALYLAMKFLKTQGFEEIYLSDPTWPNHKNIAAEVGLAVKSYPYFDRKKGALDKEGMIEELSKASKKSIVLFHACCHNPTGLDPEDSLWESLATLSQRVGFFPLFDMAYQGFGKGVQEDASALRLFAARGIEHALAYSLSKNFSLYSERVGALFFFLKEQIVECRALIGAMVRRLYSNPPRLSAAAVAEIFEDPALYELWLAELNSARERIAFERRELSSFLDTLAPERFAKLKSHLGLFSYTGLTPQEVERLAVDYGVYLLPDGRLSLAAIGSYNRGALQKALAGVL